MCFLFCLIYLPESHIITSDVCLRIVSFSCLANSSLKSFLSLSLWFRAFSLFNLYCIMLFTITPSSLRICGITEVYLFIYPIRISNQNPHRPQTNNRNTRSADNITLITETNTSELTPLMKSDRMHSATISANLALISRLKTILTQLF